VVGARTGKRFLQYYCMDCQSFSNPSGYREDEGQKRADLQYLIEHREHIERLQGQLFLEIQHRLPGIETVCEVGCGAGFFLKAVKDFGRKGLGLETNQFAAAYAREQVGVDVRSELLTKDHAGCYDLIVAIGVFEHVERPRELFEIMASKLTRDGAIYLNMPFVNREHWRFLWGAESRTKTAPPDPFYDNDVHITHFSTEGIKRLGAQLGARSSEFWESVDVVQHSAGAYLGVLFRF
jgi:SAM-dependent methyltransferase